MSEPEPGPNQTEVNREQGGVNRRQGELNAQQGEINEAQGELNDGVFDELPEASLLNAIDDFKGETTRLRQMVDQGARSRSRRDRAVTVALVAIVLVFALVWNQQRIYNHNRCVTTQTNRRLLRENLNGLVGFAIASNPPKTEAAKLRSANFLADYDAKLRHDLPQVKC